MSELLNEAISVIVALFVISYIYLKFGVYNYWKKRNVPQMDPTFPFGNMQPPHKRKRHFVEFFDKFYKEMKEKGWKYAGIYTFARPNFMPIDLDTIKLIMTKDFGYFTDRGMYVNEKDDPIGAHLFAIGGTKWRNLRTKLTPTFTSGKMKMMFQTLADVGMVLEKYIGEISEKQEPIDMKNVLGCFSTDIIASCAFGLECNTLQDQDSLFRVYSKKIFQRGRFAFLKMLIINGFPNFARALGIVSWPKDVAKFFSGVVKDTVDYREKNNIERKDFLQMLIEIKNEGGDANYTGDGKSLTINEIVAQSFVFFIAGFETSATTMSFALYELSRNPHMQDKVREELRRVLRKYDNKISYDSLAELEYMQQVIDETLRMYPPVPMYTRECVEDYHIPNTDVTIEKGTRIFIPVMSIQYDEDYYENPKVFDPERFSEAGRKDRHQYAHMPFGEGPRNCIGMRFGIMQTKVGLASVLNNYRVVLNNKTENPLKMTPASFILTAEGGVWLDIEKIK